jgi:hypothetical protein
VWDRDGYVEQLCESGDGHGRSQVKASPGGQVLMSCRYVGQAAVQMVPMKVSSDQVILANRVYASGKVIAVEFFHALPAIGKGGESQGQKLRKENARC